MHAFLNGKETPIIEGETILEAAHRAGHYIPTLCEMADIDHTPGTCRVCLVEITLPGQTETKVVTSCNTPITDGMQVRTRTPRVREMQRLQVELLLADHAQTCSACNRHGDCELQDVAQFVGLQQSRFFDPALAASRPVDTSALALVRDMRKCVRCLRCVTICREFQGMDCLVVAGTGQNLVIQPRRGCNQSASDCVSCGQCVLVCPTGALAERDEIETVVDFLYDPEIVTVFQFAPAMRVGLGEEFGLPPGANVEGQIITALRLLGADLVLDTNFAADIVIMEEGSELLTRLRDGKRPTFTSCCPAWINFAEKHYPDILPYLSSTRSPQQCFGAIAKTYLPEKMGLDPERVRVVSLMPCVAKKEEAARQVLARDGRRDVDVVLTTREFVRLLKREHIDLAALQPSSFDNPYMGEYTGAAAIFATTGGVLEAAVRTIYRLVNDHELGKVEIEALRGFADVRTASVDMGGKLGVVKTAMCHGLKGTRAMVEAVLAGEADFDFIEVMACPGGCVDGGGTLRSKKAYLPHALKRREALYAIDQKAPVRQSHNNPLVKKLYKEFLGEPLSHKAHELLHTHYIQRKQETQHTIHDIWREIARSTMTPDACEDGQPPVACPAPK